MFFNIDKSFITFTFDDVPSSATVLGSQILEEYNYRGTFYVSGGLRDKDSVSGQIASKKQIESLWKKGHEIGNHTYNHIDCKENHPVIIFQDLAKNSKMFSNIVSNNFSFPFGSSDFKSRLLLKRRFASCRGIKPGINNNLIDLLNLKAVCVYYSKGFEDCYRFISKLIETGGWLIFYTHDICLTPSQYGCRPDDFRALVEKVNSLNIHVGTINEVLEIIT
jgi:peptidoglycan/xylan/chitin deacetylase (PgdA/CDA1 family)